MKVIPLLLDNDTLNGIARNEPELILLIMAVSNFHKVDSLRVVRIRSAGAYPSIPNIPPKTVTPTAPLAGLFISDDAKTSGAL